MDNQSRRSEVSTAHFRTRIDKSQNSNWHPFRSGEHDLEFDEISDSIKGDSKHKKDAQRGMQNPEGFYKNEGRCITCKERGKEYCWLSHDHKPCISCIARGTSCRFGSEDDSLQKASRAQTHKGRSSEHGEQLSAKRARYHSEDDQGDTSIRVASGRSFTKNLPPRNRVVETGVQPQTMTPGGKPSDETANSYIEVRNFRDVSPEIRSETTSLREENEVLAKRNESLDRRLRGLCEEMARIKQEHEQEIKKRDLREKRLENKLGKFGALYGDIMRRLTDKELLESIMD